MLLEGLLVHRPSASGRKNRFELRAPEGPSRVFALVSRGQVTLAIRARLWNGVDPSRKIVRFGGARQGTYSQRHQNLKTVRYCCYTIP